MAIAALLQIGQNDPKIRVASKPSLSVINNELDISHQLVVSLS